MTEVSQLQALVDQYVSRGAVDQMPQELRQAVDAFKLRTDDPNQRQSRMTERRELAAERFEFKPQNEIEKGFAAENAEQQESWFNQIMPEWTGIGAPKLVRNPDLDSDDPNAGDVYEIGGSIFPRNLSREQRYTEGLSQYLPFGSETIGGIGGALVDSAQGIGTLIDSRTLGIGSDAIGYAYDSAVGGDAGEKFAQDANDFGMFVWQNDPKMAAGQAVASTATAIQPALQARWLANGLGGAGRSWLGQAVAGGAGGRFGLEAVAQGDANFQQDAADELKDMDVGALGGLVGMPFETGVSMRYAAPALGFVPPAAAGAARSVRSAVNPEFRARRIVASNLDTDEIRGLANRQGDVRAVDLNPRLGNTAVDLGTQGPDSGGAQLSEYLQNRRSERAPRIFDRLSDDLGDDASVELRPHNQRNILGRSQADVRTEPMRYGTAIDQSERFMGSLEEAQGVARNRGYAELSGARLPDGETEIAGRVPEDEAFDLSRHDMATNTRAAATLQRQARDMGLTGSSAQRESLEGRRFGIDGRREIPAPYTVTRNGQAVTIDPLFERRNNRPVISNNDIDNMLAERGIARTDLNGTQRRAALRDIRNQEMEAGPRAPATDQELARNPLRIQEIKRQAEGRQAAQLGPSGDPQRAGDFGLIARNARNLLERFRDASNNRPGLVGNRYFAAFERALSISRDQGGDITRVSGAYADGQKVFSGGDKFGPEMIRDRVDQMNRRIRDAEADPDFANVPGTRTNIAEATREELHAFRVGALRGYLRNIQNRTQEGGRLFNPRNPDVEARLSAIFDTPEQAQRYLDFLEDERQMAVTEGLIEGNSKTARSRADQERFEQNAESIGEAVTDLMTGAPGASTVRLLGRWFNRRYQRMWRGMTERTADEVARLLMRNDFEALAAELEAARAGRRAPRMGALPVGTQARMAAAADVVEAAEGGRIEPEVNAPRQSLSGPSGSNARANFDGIDQSLRAQYGDDIEAAYQRGEVPEAQFRAWSAARRQAEAAPIEGVPRARPDETPTMWGVIDDAGRAGDDLDPTNRSSRRMDREGYRDEEVFDNLGSLRAQSAENRFEVDDQILQRMARQELDEFNDPAVRAAMTEAQLRRLEEIEAEFQNRVVGGHRRAGLGEADARAGAGRERSGRPRRAPLKGESMRPAAPDNWATDKGGRRRQPFMLTSRGERTSLNDRAGAPSQSDIQRFEAFDEGRRLLRDIESLKKDVEIENLRSRQGAGEGTPGGRPQPPDRAPVDETPPDSPADIVPERAPAPWDTIEGGYTRPIAEIDSAVTKVRDDIRNLIRLVKGERLPDGIEYKDISRLRDKAEQDLTKASIRLATLGEDSPQAQVLRNTIDDQFLALVQAQDAFGRLGADLGERFDDVVSGMRDVSRMGDTGRNPRLPGAGEDITPGFTYGDWEKVKARLAGKSPILVEIVENIEARMGEAGPQAAGRMLNDVDKTKFKVMLSRALANADDAAEEIAHIVYALDMIPAKEMAEVRKIAKRWHVAESKRLGHDFLEPYRREAQRLGLSPEQTKAMLEEEAVVKWLSRSETWKQPKGLKGRVAAIIRQMGQLIKQTVSTSARAGARAEKFQSGRMAGEISDALTDAMTKGTREAMAGKSPVRELIKASRRIASLSDQGGVKKNTSGRDLTKTNAFKRWFGESPIVDTDGRPRVVYTSNKADVTTFDPARSGENTGFKSGVIAFSGRPDTAETYSSRLSTEADIALTERQAPLFRELGSASGRRSREILKEIETQNRDAATANASTYPAFLSLQRPLIVDMGGDILTPARQAKEIAKAKGSGNDGVWLKNAIDTYGFDVTRGKPKPDDIFLVFEPTQIKSSIGNTGAFDPMDPDIRRSLAPAR